LAKGDRIRRNARLATLDSRLPGLGIVENGAVAVSDGRIRFNPLHARIRTGRDATPYASRGNRS
jgi:imidazolonepropionase-like amidohydrolase